MRTLDRAESVEFLHKRVSADDPNHLASKLAQTLGDLPLALEQAAAVMHEQRSSYAAYLKRFETHWAELLQRGVVSADHPDSLAMSLELSYRAIEEGAPGSASLLYFCAFLSPERITRDFLRASAPALPSPLSVALTGDLDAVIGPLVRYSLLEQIQDAIQLHRLVGALVRRRLSRDEQAHWAIAAAGAVAAAYRYNSEEPSTWPAFGAGVPHVLAAGAHAEQLGVVPDTVAELLSSAGRYLLKQGRLAEAKPVLERAIDVTRRVYGNAHPRTSDAANNLGRVLQRVGELDAAAEYFALSLAIDRKTYGDEDPRVATVANNYGMCLLAGGDLPAAQHHFQWALSVYGKHYGDENPKVASVLNNLGCALRDQELHDQAGEVFQRGLAIAETYCPPNSPTTASLLYNTAMLLRAVGDAGNAEAHLRRALRIDEAVFGPSHRDVVRDLVALSRVLLETGKRDESEKVAQRARRVAAEVGGASTAPVETAT